MTLPPALLAVLALVALAVFGALCAVAGAAWMKARAAHGLGQAHDERQRLIALADHWIWETDDQHRVTVWRVPAQRQAQWRVEPPLGTPLASLAASPVLARQLQARVALADLRVDLTIGSATQAWCLRGHPRHGMDGRFLGYLGSAWPVGELEQAEFEQAALHQLMPRLDAEVLLFRRVDDASPWRLTAHAGGDRPLIAADNAQAGGGGAAAEPATHTPGSGPAAWHGLDWNGTCSRLPSAIAQALAQMPAGETRDVGDWRVNWSLVEGRGDAQAGRLVVLRRTVPPRLAAADPAAPANAAPAGQDAAAPGIDAADHESFVYSVSHDLRAPIRVVEGFARILKEDYGRFLDRIGNDHTDRILAAAARMNSMIDALLALSRLQSQPIKRQPVDLSQLARYILEDLRSAEPDREVDLQIEAGLVVQGDPTLMRIAVENLVGNAWKYSGQSPRTRIELRRETHAGQPTFVVADAGAGFDMRFADRLFGVFQRLHSAKDFQGTGVGLASVRRIIRRHGGDIWAESEVGKGARFYFTIP